MNIAAALLDRIHEQPARQVPLVHGHWFSIRLVPDLTAGDRFNIGVAFIDEAKVVHCRIAEDLGRLRCLYDDRVDMESFTLLQEVIEADLSGTIWTSPVRMASPNVEYSPMMPAAGISVDDILDSRYDAMVPFGAPRKDGAARNVPIKTERLRKHVVHLLHERFGDEILPFLSRDAIRLPKAYGTGRLIRLPLHNKLTGQAGDIVSAYTAHKETVERNLSASVRNLMALRLVDKDRSLGLFVLEPGESSFTARDMAPVHSLLDEMTDFAHGAGVQVERRGAEADIASAIGQWAHAA